MPFKGQGKVWFKCLKGVVTNFVLSQYEDNSVNNKIVAAWSSG